MGLKADVCVPLGLPNGNQGCMFISIPVDVVCYDPEIFALQYCHKTTVAGSSRSRNVNPMLDLNQVSEAGSKMSVLLEQVLQYVEDVLANRISPNNAVRRSLLYLVNSVPHINNKQFSEMFNSNVKDLLMVITLSQLIKTQFQKMFYSFFKNASCHMATLGPYEIALYENTDAC